MQLNSVRILYLEETVVDPIGESYDIFGKQRKTCIEKCIKVVQKINYQGERERKAYREKKKKKIRKKCTRIFFCGNECERCIICTYPGAKKKCLFDILFNLLFFLFFFLFFLRFVHTLLSHACNKHNAFFLFFCFFSVFSQPHFLHLFFLFLLFFTLFSIFLRTHFFHILSSFNSSLSLAQSLCVFHKLLA